VIHVFDARILQMEPWVGQDSNYWNRENDGRGISDFIILLDVLQNPSVLISLMRRVHARVLVILLAQGLSSPNFNSRLRDQLEAL
jgi:hypothetical protein